MCLGFEVAQIAAEEQEVLGLGEGCFGDVEEACEVVIRVALRSLHNRMRLRIVARAKGRFVSSDRITRCVARWCRS